jgi:hypothetical protein
MSQNLVFQIKCDQITLITRSYFLYAGDLTRVAIKITEDMLADYKLLNELSSGVFKNFEKMAYHLISINGPEDLESEYGFEPEVMQEHIEEADAVVSIDLYKQTIEFDAFALFSQSDYRAVSSGTWLDTWIKVMNLPKVPVKNAARQMSFDEFEQLKYAFRQNDAFRIQGTAYIALKI